MKVQDLVECVASTQRLEIAVSNRHESASIFDSPEQIDSRFMDMNVLYIKAETMTVMEVSNCEKINIATLHLLVEDPHKEK